MNNSVDLTTNIGCRVQCKFCPQDVSMSNYAIKNGSNKIEFGKPILLPYETFVKILKKMQSENDEILCRNCEFALSVNKEKNLKQQFDELGINPSDEIGIKLDELYQYYLQRSIDPEGLIFFYMQIKNGIMTYDDVEKQIMQSAEYISIPKKNISNN